MSAPERHSAETKNNGTAIRHAPQRIVANKSKGAQWGSSGRWISPHTPQFGMCVEYVRADLHDALLTRLASAEAALARAREEAAASQAAFDATLVGGNSLATVLIGRLGGGFSDRFPAREEPWTVADRLSSENYELWLCWRAMINARDDLRALRNGERGGGA